MYGGSTRWCRWWTCSRLHWHALRPKSRPWSQKKEGPFRVQYQKGKNRVGRGDAQVGGVSVVLTTRSDKTHFPESLRHHANTFSTSKKRQGVFGTGGSYLAASHQDAKTSRRVRPHSGAAFPATKKRKSNASESFGMHSPRSARANHLLTSWAQRTVRSGAMVTTPEGQYGGRARPRHASEVGFSLERCATLWLPACAAQSRKTNAPQRAQARDRHSRPGGHNRKNYIARLL